LPLEPVPDAYSALLRPYQSSSKAAEAVLVLKLLADVVGKNDHVVNFRPWQNTLASVVGGRRQKSWSPPCIGFECVANYFAKIINIVSGY
jgi:hypothetical protein